MLDRRIRSLIPAADPTLAALQIEVAYADLSTEAFHAWDECFDEATDAADAESLRVRWEAVNPLGAIYRVDMKFTTEMPFDYQRMAGPIHEAVGVEVRATAPSRDWVHKLFAVVEPIVTSARLPRIYRPLEKFANDIFREVTAWLLGAAAWYASLRALQSLVADRTSKHQLKEILAHPDLSGRFEEFLRQFYGNHQSFVAGLLVFLIPYGLLFLCSMFGGRYLGYLVPKSSVSIGLSARRYKDYLNLFRFVVFTLLIGGLLAVAVNVLTSVI
jgi:hypothetical protein